MGTKWHAGFGFLLIAHGLVAAAWFVLCWVGSLQPALLGANRLFLTYASLVALAMLPRLHKHMKFAYWAIAVCNAAAIIPVGIYAGWLILLRTANAADYASATQRMMIPLIWQEGTNAAIAWSALALCCITAAVHILTVVVLLVKCFRETPSEEL